MYNRYIPQSDGSYKRSRVQEPQKPLPPHNGNTCQESHPTVQPPLAQPRPLPKPCRDNRPPVKYPHKDPLEGSIQSFFRNLLPGDFDTGDLFVILLLLLMSGDCREDQNTALLTLALYLFM